MRTAFLNGMIGSFLVWLLGTSFFNLSFTDVLQCVGASVVAGLACTLITTRAEQRPWIRKNVLTRQRRTWYLFLTVYFSVLLWGAPPVRAVAPFATLVVPLVLCTGFTIMIYGPIQDKLMRRAQRRARRRAWQAQGRGLAQAQE